MKVRDTSRGRMYALSSEIGCTAINGAMAVDIPAGGQSVVLALDKKLIIAGDDNAKFVEVRWGTNAAIGSRPSPSWMGDILDGLVSIVGADKFDVNYIPGENKLYLIFSLDTTSAQIEEVKSLCARVLPSNVVTEMEWADGLPMTYTRLEYLESTGTQYIDTDVKLSDESEVRCDYSVRRVYEKNCYLLGAGGGSLYTYATETVNTAPNSAIFYALNAKRNTTWTDVQKFNEKNSLILSNKQCSLNGVTRNLKDSEEAFETLDCFVFARNEGVYVLPSSGIVYSFNISRNSRSQLNLIPTLDHTGRPCMFDTVTRKPFYNAATIGTDFIAGMTWEQVRELSLPSTGGQLTLSLPYEASIDGLAQAALEQARANGWELTLQYTEAEVPAGYTRLDYLESAGTQWIDTGIKLSNESEVRVTLYTEENDGHSSQSPYGWAGDTSKQFYCFSQYYLESTQNYMSLFYLPKNFIRSKARVIGKCDIIHNAEGFTVNGVNTPRTTEFDPFETPGNCRVFSNSGGAYFWGSIYAFNISRSNSLQLAYIPCLDPEGVPCMFDLVSRQPFRNKGTGQFIAGMTLEQVRSLSLPAGGGRLTLSLPYEASIDKLAQDALEQARANGWELTLQYAASDVPAGYRKLDFLESTGTQWIDIGTVTDDLTVAVTAGTQSASSVGVVGYYKKLAIYVSQFSARVDRGSASVSASFVWPQKIDVLNAPDHCVINGINYDWNEDTSFETVASWSLFGVRSLSFYPARVYSFSIARAGEMQADYVPCISPDGTLGMYNKVDGTLHENAGSGAFIAGLATIDDVRNLWLPEINGELTVSVPADTPDSAVEQLRTNNPTWQIAIQFRTDNEN